MADMDMHEVVFEWPQTGPSSVIVTGTFDKWTETRKLTKTANGFVCTAKIPWNEKILYKYIVDGKWALVYGVPVEVESRTGFVNHVYIAPPKPQVALPTSKPEPVIESVGTNAEPKDVDKNLTNLPTTSPESGAIAVASPLTEDSVKGPTELSVTPIALVDPIQDVGEGPMADAKSDSGTTAVADPEVTADVMNAPEPIPSPTLNKPSPKNECEADAAEKKMKGKPAALPKTPSKREVFPSVSPPSSPSHFTSLRRGGKKTRTKSFLAKLKELFKSDKDKDKISKEKAETKT